METIERMMMDDFQLKSDLPETMDLCHFAHEVHRPGEGIWHTPSCHKNHWKRTDTWTTGVPTYVALQMWPTATWTSPVGYCQLCTIEKKE